MQDGIMGYVVMIFAYLCKGWVMGLGIYLYVIICNCSIGDGIQPSCVSIGSASSATKSRGRRRRSSYNRKKEYYWNIARDLH